MKPKFDREIKTRPLDEDEHGNEVIVETYGVATTAPQQYESWGCF